MLNLAQNQNKIRLFLIILGVIVLVIVAFGIFSALSHPQKPAPSPAPSIKAEVLIPSKSQTEKQPENIKQIREKIIASPIANQNGDLVLYEKDSFRIVYVPPIEIFFVQISKDPTLSKKAAQDWFINFGLKQTDLCALPVRFLLYNPDLKKTNPNFSLLPDGCSPT